VRLVSPIGGDTHTGGSGNPLSIVYATDVPDVNELLNRILLVSDQIRNNVDVFENLRTGLLGRARLCTQLDGRRFEHLL
jgi:hypothetical protein